jgi:hypothetical protein
MPGVAGDIVACSLGLVFPYALFIGFGAPFNLWLDTSRAGRFEKLAYRRLKPALALSGLFAAGACYADRHSDNGLIFGLLLAATFAVWTLTVPAGALAFRQNHGWDKKRTTYNR